MSAHETDHGGCSDRHDDLAAYALGALPPGEAAALEQHLAGCEPAASACSGFGPRSTSCPPRCRRSSRRPASSRT